VCTRERFVGVKRAEREAIHWPLYSAKARTGWSYAITPDIRFNGIHREFFDLFLSSKEEAVWNREAQKRERSVSR